MHSSRTSACRSRLLRPLAVLVTLAALGAPTAHAQLPVTPASDQESQLTSPDPKLAANKHLVYDFWREVLEAGHLDLAPKYLTDDYLQHNPNVPTGRAGFVTFFSRFAKPTPVAPRIQAPLVAVLAERDLVTLVFAREMKDPKDPKVTYTTTRFDMFRVQDGRIAEHWDPDVKH